MNPSPPPSADDPRLLLALATLQLTGWTEMTAKTSVAVEASLGFPEAGR